jgi:hypothetical protein
MAERFITIATFNNLTEAHIVKGRLEASGILCFLKDENIVAVQPFYSFAVGGIKLQVTEGDVEEAHDILKQIRLGENEYILDDSIELALPEQEKEIACPVCGSDRVEEIEPDSLSTFSRLFRRHIFKCRNCGNSWK